MSLGDAVATAPRRRLTGSYWHQGATRHPLTSCADPALGPGRYHRAGEPGVWYASNLEQGAWAELFRHFVDEGVDPFEVRRRVGRVSVDLHVLDLTDKTTRSHLGVDEADLVSDDCATTQTIACAARDAGFDAVLAPAAALPGCETLAVFVHTLPNVTAERSEVRQPPPRLADLLPLIRPHEAVPDTVRRLLITLERAGPKQFGADAADWLTLPWRDRRPHTTSVAKLVTTKAATDDVPFVRSGRKIVIAPTSWLHQNPDLG